MTTPSTSIDPNKEKVAFITGITGQDGSYLSEYLVSLGYTVHGIVRRNSIPENQSCRIERLSDKIHLHYGDLLDQSSLERVLLEVKPDEIYNLAAQSHVRISYDVPQFTVKTNALGVLNLLESYRKTCPNARFYQASSSEMFGNSIEKGGEQNELTPMHPVSPYGCTKVFAYNICKNYRNAYKLFITQGILFNHESPRRGSNFVTNKIVKAAVRISLGLQDSLELGNLDSFRDWGHSKDYVKAMHKIINHHTPTEFVVSTGITHSIRELCEYAFSKVNLNYKDYVVQNPKYMRPEELKYLKGDCTKAKKVLGWNPKYTFETLLDEMIEYWQRYYAKEDHTTVYSMQ
jgi:GDPmannose 4,6-dehydratase